MKKRTFQLLSLLLLFCMAGSFFACQKEEPSHRGGNLIEDGIKRSELRYVENPYFKDGKIYYTLVNNKNENHRFRSAARRGKMGRREMGDLLSDK